jgi:hypothetical protein
MFFGFCVLKFNFKLKLQVEVSSSELTQNQFSHHKTVLKHLDRFNLDQFYYVHDHDIQTALKSFVWLDLIFSKYDETRFVSQLMVHQSLAV